MEAKSIKELLENGWLYINGIFELNSFKKILQDYTKSEFDIVENILSPHKIGDKILTLSKIYGLDQFPFHTDGAQYTIPPRYIVLENKSEDEEIANTNLIDGFKVSAGQENLFYNSIFEIQGNGFKELTPIINCRKIDKEKILRFNPEIMISVIKRKKTILNNLINNYPRIKIKWHSNDYLVIDNWRMLHSRDEVNVNSKRKIRRLSFYIKNYE
jgi:hypothetical protein